jgi:hypothetical protein
MSYGSPVHHKNGLYCGPAVGPGDVGILLVPRESVRSLTRELPAPRTVAPSTPSRIAAGEAPLGRAGGGAPQLSPRRLRIPRACRPPRRSPCTSAAAGLPPEAISPAKFFPKLAAACHCYALFEVWFLDAQRANRGGGCARPRGSSVGSPASRWMQSPWKRGQVGGGNAASVRRGSTGSGRRMCVVVRRSSN